MTTTVVGVDNVQIVSADEVNDIDRKADSPVAVSLDALSRDLAGSRSLYTSAEPKAEPEFWFQRMLMVFGGAFAGVAALVRVLLGYEAKQILARHLLQFRERRVGRVLALRSRHDLAVDDALETAAAEQHQAVPARRILPAGLLGVVAHA